MISAIFGPGRYFLGDPLFCIEDELFDELFGNGDLNKGVHTIRGGAKIVIDGTLCEDGVFMDSVGTAYHVQTACIALIPEELWDPRKSKARKDMGRIIDTRSSISFSAVEGTFTVGFDNTQIVIETYDETYDDDCYDES